jgi:hypothetical protein
MKFITKQPLGVGTKKWRLEKFCHEFSETLSEDRADEMLYIYAELYSCRIRVRRYNSPNPSNNTTRDYSINDTESFEPSNQKLIYLDWNAQTMKFQTPNYTMVSNYLNPQSSVYGDLVSLLEESFSNSPRKFKSF